MSILIVLFGQENEPDGTLRLPAATRAARAAELWKELSPGSEVVILPTGAFGQHFNMTAHAHFYYLAQELIRLGVPSENILPGANSSNTLQDATESWYRFKSGGFDRLIAVTSDYHAERVAFLLGRLSSRENAEIEVVTAVTPAGYTGKDRQLEGRKVERLRREWVEVIPRTSKVPPERFVSAYENADREYRHHNTLSFVVAAGLLAVNAFAFCIVPGNGGWTLFFLLLFLAVIDFVLWLIFDRMTNAARIARWVLTRMEIEHRLPGFSSNWKPQFGEWFRTPPWFWSLRDLVTALAAALFLTVAIVSLGAPGERSVETAPGRTSSANANSASPNANGSGNANALDRWANSMERSVENTNSSTNQRRRR